VIAKTAAEHAAQIEMLKLVVGKIGMAKTKRRG